MSKFQIINKNGTAVNVSDNNELFTTKNTTLKTASLLRVTDTIGTVAAGASNVSFFNAGNINIVNVQGAILKPGETVTFDANDNILNELSYDATGVTDLVINQIR
jgi:hypothetical protein